MVLPSSIDSKGQCDVAKVNLFAQTSNTKGQAEFQRFASALLQALYGVVNGQLDFGENVRAAGPYVLGFTAAAQVITVPHNLGFVPKGILPVKLLGAAQTLYAPSGATLSWTNDKIYLQASGAVTATIFVI